ncbi:hypothetical protein D9M72_647420 [compost metagenome]
MDLHHVKRRGELQDADASAQQRCINKCQNEHAARLQNKQPWIVCSILRRLWPNLVLANHIASFAVTRGEFLDKFVGVLRKLFCLLSLKSQCCRDKCDTIMVGCSR